MLASGASTSAPMVCTGADMISLTGACRETPSTTTLSRRSTSVTMPDALAAGPRTRIAERFSAIRIFAASCALVPGSQKSGLLRVTDVTGSVRTSGMRAHGAGRLYEALARVAAIHWMPDGPARGGRRATSRGRQ